MAVILRIINDAMNLTVDNSSITVDNSIITVDLTSMTGDNQTIIITPTEFIEDVTVSLRNELTDVVSTVSGTCVMNGSYVYLSFKLEVVSGDSFTIMVYNPSNELIWQGKGYATDYNDIQNFTQLEKNNNNVIKL